MFGRWKNLATYFGNDKALSLLARANWARHTSAQGPHAQCIGVCRVCVRCGGSLIWIHRRTSSHNPFISCRIQSCLRDTAQRPPFQTTSGVSGRLACRPEERKSQIVHGLRILYDSNTYWLLWFDKGKTLCFHIACS